ncbi:MAG TPA: 30S ribosomal protein S6 [Bacteroidetes bacterium]|jgi:small subunit ribosomal protein S6|nr:30S ribosomal protein S6 [Bacteroidota bacterium]
MDTSHHTYETTIIINASLDDTQIDTAIGRVQETITKNGGAVTALNKWGRKRLAYSISKKTNGFYVNIEFTAPSTLIGLLERSYQLDEMVLRYLTIKLDKKAIAAKAKLAMVPVELEAAPVPAREPLFDDSATEKKSE